MEWVETTGRDIEEAKRSALEQLGVDESDAEIEILAEARLGLFGRLREEARVRARVRPRYPRAKGQRRDRQRSRAQLSARDTNDELASVEAGGSATTQPDLAKQASATTRENGRSDSRRRRHDSQAQSEQRTSAAPTGRGGNTNGAALVRPAHVAEDTMQPDSALTVVAEATAATRNKTRGEQIRLAKGFLDGLLAQLGAEAKVSSHLLDNDTVELILEGKELGTLIGPRGATLLALQELTRTVTRRGAGPGGVRILVDVNGYRKRRQEALIRFVERVAAEVKATNSSRALEPMSAADRKLVHDVVNSIAGVGTVSQGEEPNRRVVLVPVSADEGSQSDEVSREVLPETPSD